MKKLILATLAVGILFVTSCTKQGPVGPQGPTGATGNANVIGSDHITVNAWTYYAPTFTYSATFAYADITSSVANYGLVEIYEQYTDGSWTNLPDINNGVQTVFNFSTGSFTIYMSKVDGSYMPAPSNPITFRVVVIPSSVRQANPNTNWKDYKQAMAALAAAKADGTMISK